MTWDEIVQQSIYVAVLLHRIILSCPSHNVLPFPGTPSYDRFFSESWANRRTNVRLVAEVVDDR